MIYGDFFEMYQLNINNLYFIGIREITSSNFVGKEIDKSRFICAGVMLMNLKLLRKAHSFDTFKKYYLKFIIKNIL